MKVSNQKNFATGALYTLFGVAVAIMSTDYRMGTVSQMGPGYFPFWLGVLLAVTGAVVLIGSLFDHGAGDETRLTRWDLRSLALVSVAVILFGIVLTYLGLVAAVVTLIVVSSFASHEFSWTMTLFNTAILLVITFVIFVYGLDLQFEVWPPFLGD